jgi:hypothetical protein
MKISFLRDDEYQQRFNELNSFYPPNVINNLKVKYSEKILHQVGEIFDVFPPPKKSNKMKAQSCYRNAIQKTYIGYQYVEGVIINKKSGYKISHAWNVNSEGNHIDFTILYTEDYLYKGIILPGKIVSNVGFKNGSIMNCCLPYLDVVQ